MALSNYAFDRNEEYACLKASGLCVAQYDYVLSKRYPEQFLATIRAVRSAYAAGVLNNSMTCDI
jgi:hypothetical protein